MIAGEELAQDLLKAMRETYNSSLAAGFCHAEAWDKVMVRYKARCAYLLQRHPSHVVEAAAELLAEHLKAVKQAGKEV